MNRDLILVAVSLFTWGIGEGMFLIFQPIYLQQWGASPVLIGALLGGSGIAMTIAQAPAGYLADKFGSRPIMLGSWVLGASASIVMAVANSMTWFVVGMLAYGLTSFVLAPMNSYITNVRGRWSVARALTLVSAAFNLGAVGGPLIGGYLGDRYGLKTVYLIASGFFMLSTLIVFMVSPVHPEHHAEGDNKNNGVLQNRPFILLLGVAFLSMLAVYLPQPLTANFLENVRHLSLTQIGQLGAIGSLGNALLALAFGGLSAPVGIVLGEALVGLYALALWLGPGEIWYAVGYFFIGGYRLCRSMILAVARSLVPARETGFAYGLIETANALTVIVAPPLAGVLYTKNPYLVFSVSFFAILAVIVLNVIALPGLHHAAVQPAETVVQMERSEP